MSNEPTTSTALEQARRSFEAADSGDYDWMISFYGPDSIFDMEPWGLGTYEGLVAIKAFFKDWIGAFDEFEMKLEELADLGNGVVFGVARQYATSAGSNPLQLRHAAVSVWEGGVAVLVRNYPDIEEARVIAQALAASRG
ncbi:MAG TPA: nuclear transport factor 2 family protein [Solirubrobacteraceae bacterium]|jgi:ketosteroid isomerase-like protein|nr:nuclear transport factor 2 family protein [Solirubrobacteraceae bacterium]